MILLLLKASIITAVLWGFYKLFLERESFFAANRIYFISSLVLAFVLPFISLPELVEQQGVITTMLEEVDTPEPTRIPIENNTLDAITIEAPIVSPQVGFSPVSVEPVETQKGLGYWLMILYYFGVIVFSFNLLSQILSIIFKIIKSTDKVEDIHYNIINSTETGEPSSFFNYIFINPESYDYNTYEQILAHEEVHIKKRHSIDLLLAEIAAIFLWFNPFIWLFRKDVENNIEYQTDDLLINKQEIEKEQYQMNLLKVATYQKPLSISTNYNQSLIKKRILKMSAKKSNPHTYWKYAFVAPVVFMMLLIMNKPTTSFAQLVTEDPVLIYNEVPVLEENRSLLSYNDLVLDDDELILESDLNLFSQSETLVSQTNMNPFEGTEELVRELSPNDACKDLIDAILDENISEVKALMRSIVPNCVNTTESYRIKVIGKNQFYMHDPRTPLVAAASVGNIEIGRLLLSAGADIEFHAKGDETPLMAAASHGNFAFVKYMVRSGADIYREVRGDGTALLVAARSGHVDIVEYLHREGAHISTNMRGEGTPLSVAARSGHLDVVKYLVSKGADINSYIQGEGTPLIVAARSGHFNIVQYLISQGAKVDAVVPGEGTALIKAVKSSQYQIVEFLLRNGANPYLNTPGDEYAMYHARKMNNKKMIKLLEQYKGEAY